MMDESEMYELTIGRKQKNLLLSFVVVILAMGIALSGWLITSAIQQMQDDDPFSMEREYIVTGTMIESGEEVECTGTITTHFSSETVIASIMTYHVSVKTPDSEMTFRYDLKFDENREPDSRYEYLGTEDGYDRWKGTQNGIETVYYLDGDNAVHYMEISYEGAELFAQLAENM